MAPVLDGEVLTATSQRRVSALIAEVPIVFDCPSLAVRDAVAHLLANHRAARTEDDAIEVALDIHRHGETKLRCVQNGLEDRRWRWTIAPQIATALPNRLYYWAILPILVRVLAANDVMRLHAAAIDSAWSGGILILGDSGAGKSTTTAGWLEGGGRVIADDTLFAREVGAAFTFYGLRRPLHVPFDMVGHFARLRGCQSAPEYLPGRRKVGYDAWGVYPERAVAAMTAPRSILLSSVADRARTLLHPAPSRTTAAALRRAVTDVGLPDVVSQRVYDRCWCDLSRVTAWTIRWGRDVFTHPEKHHGVLRELLRKSS